VKVLDVGSGVQPKGDVNVDICKYDAPNFVRADGCYLPFADCMFDLVISQNVIEHVPLPFHFLGEMKRVSKEWIIIVFPHWLGDDKRNWDKTKLRHHVCSFNSAWFKQAAKLLELVWFNESCLSYRHYPWLSGNINQYLGFLFRFPGQMSVTLRKVQVN